MGMRRRWIWAGTCWGIFLGWLLDNEEARASAYAAYWSGLALLGHYILNEGWPRFKAWLHVKTSH